jgi:hypothetical protein
MAIAAYYHPPGLTLEQFNEVHRRLDAAGASSPAGRLHHSCMGDDGDLMVYEVWDSQGNMEAFAAVLMPVLGEVGIDPGTPAFMPVHRLDQQESKP